MWWFCACSKLNESLYYFFKSITVAMAYLRYKSKFSGKISNVRKHFVFIGNKVNCIFIEPTAMLLI